MDETPKSLNDVAEVTPLVRINPDQFLKPKLLTTTLSGSPITESGPWEVLNNCSVIVAWVIGSTEVITAVPFIVFYWKRWAQFTK